VRSYLKSKQLKWEVEWFKWLSSCLTNAKFKAVSSYCSTTKKKKRNAIGHILFMTLSISLDHLRSCGSSLLSVESWISNFLGYCNEEETPHKAKPKSLNHYVFFSFCFMFACFFMYWDLNSGSCTSRQASYYLSHTSSPKSRFLKEVFRKILTEYCDFWASLQLQSSFPYLSWTYSI
jgi:hypothetical protein